jgi:hypothetical protein
MFIGSLCSSQQKIGGDAERDIHTRLAIQRNARTVGRVERRRNPPNFNAGAAGCASLHHALPRLRNRFALLNPHPKIATGYWERETA